MLIYHKGHTDTIQVYSVTVMTHVKALQVGHSSQGTSEPITPALTVDEHSSDHKPPNITESDVISDSGSVFQSYAATVTTLNDVSAVMNNVLQKPGISSANHVVYAYRISGDSDSILENFCSDRDHGLELELLKSMRSVDVIDTVCVTTRTCDSNYIHLVKKRFQYIRDTATEALNKL